jgi:dTDP-4-dehydrorhamnose reductase
VYWPARSRARELLKTKSKIVIIGCGGRLGAALMREYHDKFDVTGFNHLQLDLESLDEIRKKLCVIDFDVLINAAAFTNVDLCERERDQALRINAEAPCVVAEICQDKNARLVHFSTDYVFEGEKREPYTESDPANPISVYGESKRAGEKFVLQTGDRHLIVRVSWVFGPDRPSFIDGIIKRARESNYVDAIADKFSTPTYTRDIAQMLPQFFELNVEGGILHFANSGECSWQEYAQWALDCCASEGIALKAKTVGALKVADMKDWIARRPVYSVLSTAKYSRLTGDSPRAWRDAVADYIMHMYATNRA